jgi:L-ascorbate metabolism protein UlaG (beta-lactamase superfamily)
MYHNYDGKRFYNLDVTYSTGKLRKFIKWQFSKKKTTWPKWQHITPANNIAERIQGDELVVTFINHATVLIQTQGLNIITDPVYSKRVSPIKFLGPKRIKAPGIKFEDLPHIDIILLSHDHYDHLDLDTIKQLNKKFAPKIFAGLKINDILKKAKLNLDCHELGWWEKSELTNGIKIHFLPAKHWSGRHGFYGVNSTLWGSFVIEAAAGNIYFAGDTGYASHFRLIKDHFKSFRLALLPIGAYEPRWFMQDFHTNPNEAVVAHKELNAKYSMAIHYGTFKLSDEDYLQPAADLRQALLQHKVDFANFRLIDEGQSWQVPLEQSL